MMKNGMKHTIVILVLAVLVTGIVSTYLEEQSNRAQVDWQESQQRLSNLHARIDALEGRLYEMEQALEKSTHMVQRQKVDVQFDHLPNELLPAKVQLDISEVGSDDTVYIAFKPYTPTHSFNHSLLMPTTSAVDTDIWSKEQLVLSADGQATGVVQLNRKYDYDFKLVLEGADKTRTELLDPVEVFSWTRLTPKIDIIPTGFATTYSSNTFKEARLEFQLEYVATEGRDAKAHTKEATCAVIVNGNTVATYNVLDYLDSDYSDVHIYRLEDALYFTPKDIDKGLFTLPAEDNDVQIEVRVTDSLGTKYKYLYDKDIF